MTWHRANKRRRIIPPRPVECHLGDVCGDPMPLGRPLYARSFDHPRWIERGVDFVIKSFGLAVLCAMILIVLFGIFAPLRAHDSGDWVRQQGFKNAIGELCCGERDCVALALDDVIVTRAGFYIRSLKETVPYSEATPAPTEAGGRYWRCAWGGQRKCFFAPQGSS